jgi:shikimate dehydrogenase
MYGLVGKKLGHSFSKEIHNAFGNNNYQLFETDSIEDFIHNNDFKGLNVTIPYKTEIIPFIDVLDEISEVTQSVNTVIKKDNLLYGYNTDYYGLKESFSYKNITLQNKKILILGNGSVSKTVQKLMFDMNAEKVDFLCRNIKNSYEHLFIDYIKFLDYDILINTTPVGMYPNNDDDLLIDISMFKNLEVVVDLIYNPFRTKLILEAEKHNIQTINGLYMLVMQAKKAHELFNEVEIPLNYSNKVYQKIYHSYINYVFVGLPLSGKTKYAKTIGQFFSKETIDIDEYIEKNECCTIPEIFDKQGEKAFRTMESNAVSSIYKRHNLAVSTGGGLIENSVIMNMLKQNGMIIFLNKDPVAISKKKIYGRPLLKDSKNILVLSKRRNPLYIEHSDIVINLDNTMEYHINEIKEKVYEYISR